MFELFFNILTVLTNSSNVFVFVCLCLIQESVYKKILLAHLGKILSFIECEDYYHNDRIMLIQCELLYNVSPRK